MCHYCYRYCVLQYVPLLETICKSIIINSPIGFHVALTNVDARLKQRCINLVPTLFQRCFNVGHWRCIKVVQRWRFDVIFFFIFNVGSTLFQCWSITLKQCWSDVEMLAGKFRVPVINVLDYILFSRLYLGCALFIESNHQSFFRR